MHLQSEHIETHQFEPGYKYDKENDLYATLE